MNTEEIIYLIENANTNYNFKNKIFISDNFLGMII